MAKGILRIVSTPIGNPADISIRAIDAIQNCDLLISEEAKPARKLLAGLGLKKEFILLNEHTTTEATQEALDLLESGKNLTLISDDGTPLLADPGSELVYECIEHNISIMPIPGPSSILAALVASGFSLLSFTFCGFLPRDKQARKKSAREYKTRKETLVFLEAPYRLSQILDDLAEGLGSERRAVVCINLTMPSEKFERGSLSALQKYFSNNPFKGEFVIVVEGAGAKFLPKIRQRR
jgi:16S rRNA (cytidine1402-2'-O)-methyltransferase